MKQFFVPRRNMGSIPTPVVRCQEFFLWENGEHESGYTFSEVCSAYHCHLLYLNVSIFLLLLYLNKVVKLLEINL